MIFDVNFFDAFLRGEASPEDRRAFEQAIAADNELKQTFEFHKKIVSGIAKAGEQMIRERVIRIGAEEIPKLGGPAPSKNRNLFLGILIAGALTLAAFFVFRPGSTQKTKDINYANVFASNYIPYTAIERTTDTSARARAVQLYMDKAYATALAVFESSTFINEPEIQILAGVSAIETGDLAKASLYFEKATASPTFEAEAKWYLALIAVKQEDNNRACTWLTSNAKDTKTVALRKALNCQ